MDFRTLRILEDHRPQVDPVLVETVLAKDADLHYTTVVGSPLMAHTIRDLLATAPQNVLLLNPGLRQIVLNPMGTIGLYNQFLGAMYVLGFDGIEMDVNLTEAPVGETDLTPKQLDLWASFCTSPILLNREYIRYLDLSPEPTEGQT